MLLSINYYNLAYTCLYLIFFCLSYFVILSSNLEKLFKQGHIWQIRIAQVLLALIVAYLVTEGIMALVNATQFS